MQGSATLESATLESATLESATLESVMLESAMHPSGKGKKGKGRVKSFGKKQKPKKPEADILSPAAMLNLYYIAHNVADCLYLRGYPWPGAPKGRKGKSKI
ncbi:small lysine-rich protein 1 [Arvicola amphibius]|uniref:small lysine-rich protein 1 n=1 Tax=Arvicola amphibius TaxID=1047088 RepID=UPI0018E2BCC1|nr:small lysine-rich protein 1 [Arvicola amphibius]